MIMRSDLSRETHPNNNINYIILHSMVLEMTICWYLCSKLGLHLIERGELFKIHFFFFFFFLLSIIILGFLDWQQFGLGLLQLSQNRKIRLILGIEVSISRHFMLAVWIDGMDGWDGWCNLFYTSQIFGK